MNKISLKSKNTLIPIAVVLLLAILGYYFFSSGGSDVVTVVDEQTGAPLGQDILILSDKLDSLSIDPSVFSSALFTTLVDISSPLLPELQGRANPFAAVGVEGGNSASVSSR